MTERVTGEPRVCAACSVDVGECSRCGTYWFYQGSKHYGVRPMSHGSHGPTFSSGRQWPFLDRLPNVVRR